MKHIMLYLCGLENGGTEHVALNLAEGLYARGYKVTLVITSIHGHEQPYSDGINLIVTEGPNVEFNQGRIGNFRKRYHILRDIWKQEKPDTIVSFIGKNNMMALMTAVGLGIPVFVAVRGEPTLEYYTPLLRFISKTLFVKAKGVIVQTERMKEYFPRYLRRKCIKLPNSLGSDFLQIPDDRIPNNTIVTVGRCNENKNQKMLIDAFAKISDKYPNVDVVIYGEGESRGTLLEYIDRIGFTDRISMPGDVNGVKELIKNSLMFVLTSDTEGMPNALMEAMALGIPVISTDCPCGGPAELIHSGENGILIPVGDTDALAKEMKRLLDDVELRQRIGNAASKIVCDLTEEKVIKQWVSVIG